MNTSLLKSRAAEIAELINQGIAAWEAAGAKLVELLDAGNTLAEVQGMIPGDFPRSVLESFEAIGRRQVVPALMIADYPAAGHLRKMRIEQQEHLMANGVELLLMGEAGADTLVCSVRDLTAAQCRQVFDNGSVRSVPRQRAWVEADRARLAMKNLMAPAAAELPYQVRGKKLIVTRPAEFSRQQLAQLLARMEE